VRFLHDKSADVPAFAGFCTGVFQDFKSGADITVVALTPS
jgi:hypothetical protein